MGILHKNKGYHECILQRIGQCKQKLVALVAHLHCISIVFEGIFLNNTITVFDVIIGVSIHKGVEIAIGLRVLVGQINSKLIDAISKTYGETIGALPVGVVGSRTII